MLEDIKQKIMESEDPAEKQELIYRANIECDREFTKFNHSVEEIINKYKAKDGIVDSALSGYVEEYKQGNGVYRYGGPKDKAREFAHSSITRLNEFAQSVQKQVLTELNQQTPIKVDFEIKTVTFPVPEDDGFFKYYSSLLIPLSFFPMDKKRYPDNAEYLEEAFIKIVDEARIKIKICIDELCEAVIQSVNDGYRAEIVLLNKLKKQIPLGKTIEEIESQYNSCVNEADSIVDKYTVSGGLIEKCFDDILAKYKLNISHLSKGTENSDKILEQRNTETVKEIKDKTESLQESILNEIQDAFSLFIDLSKPPIVIGVNLDSSIPQYEESAEDKCEEHTENDIAGLFVSFAKALSEATDLLCSKESSQIDFEMKKDNSTDEIENLCIVATSSLSRYAFKVSTIYGAEAVQNYFNKKQEILNLK